jgi:short-subunit dehydrogenase
MADRTIVVFGSGPGIGVHVASEFATHGFSHIILLARNDSRLQEDKAFIAKAAGSSDVKIDILTVDLSNLESIPDVLKRIDELSSEIEVVFFNAARIRASEPLSTPVEEIEEDFKVCSRLHSHSKRILTEAARYPIWPSM